jgi:hypothetical protein
MLDLVHFQTQQKLRIYLQHKYPNSGYLCEILCSYWRHEFLDFADSACFSSQKLRTFVQKSKNGDTSSTKIALRELCFAFCYKKNVLYAYEAMPIFYAYLLPHDTKDISVPLFLLQHIKDALYDFRRKDGKEDLSFVRPERIFTCCQDEKIASVLNWSKSHVETQEDALLSVTDAYESFLRKTSLDISQTDFLRILTIRGGYKKMIVSSTSGSSFFLVAATFTSSLISFQSSVQDFPVSSLFQENMLSS